MQKPPIKKGEDPLKHAEESKKIDEILGSSEEIKEAYEVLERTFWTGLLV